jgi:DNA-binding transcriptional ArsR family regulator
MNNFILVTKALSDTNRVRALMALRSGELCVCQIIELLDLAPSTVSKHMSILRHAGLVASRKEERWMYYRLPGNNEMPEMVRKAVKWVFEQLENSDLICADFKNMKKIMKQNPSRLCKMQRSR